MSQIFILNIRSFYFCLNECEAKRERTQTLKAAEFIMLLFVIHPCINEPYDSAEWIMILNSVCLF